ncbi:MAG TPA: hypothetical protein DDY78_24545 [Planctomycetales bacterium]|jgi:hypothetical protein|nr:hypothetical protein [Planctomycetales bacterium]
MLPPQKPDSFTAGIVQKKLSGQRLNDDEKIHLFECESCMTELMRRLDQAAEEAKKASGKNGARDYDELARTRPEAMRALEHGRRVFAREFGITL